MHHLTRAIVLATSFVSTVLADTPIPLSTFQNNAAEAARQAAPLWLLPEGSCFPSAASTNGQQTNGNDPDNCNLGKLDNNCPTQPNWAGPYTKAHDFPTYYMVRECPDLNQWRILYDVYFTKDTGHKSDWEWAVVAFKPSSDGSNNWSRDSVIMENEGDHGYSTWASIPEAYVDNLTDNDGALGNHAKLYMAKWHHSVHTTSHTDTFKNTCPPSGNVDFRNDDYYWNSGDWLEESGVLDPNWVWGKADSDPAEFGPGGKYDICTKM